MTGQETHEAGTGIYGTTVCIIAVRVTGQHRTLKVEVNKGAGSRQLVGITASVERQKASTSTSNSFRHRKVIS